MPASKAKRKQLSTNEFNEPRFLIKIRWPVESVHGVLKQKYHLLGPKIDNKLIPKIGSYFRMTSFLNKTFGEILQSIVDTFDVGHSRVSMLKVPPNQMQLCINHIKILDKK